VENDDSVNQGDVEMNAMDNVKDLLHLVEAETDPAIAVRRLRDAVRTYIANDSYNYKPARTSLAKRQADLISPGGVFLTTPGGAEHWAGTAPANTTDPAAFDGDNDKSSTGATHLEPPATSFYL
jgi:hypothetical protein